jgi:hypothetical protein
MMLNNMPCHAGAEVTDAQRPTIEQVPRKKVNSSSLDLMYLMGGM